MTDDLVRKRIKELWASAWRASEDWFMEMDHVQNEAEISAALTKIAKERELELDDMKGIFQRIKQRDEAQFARDLQKDGECRERRKDLKVYYVYNKADRKLTVLAKSSFCALRFAKVTGHIHEEKNGRVMVLKDEHEQKLRVDGSALGRALRDGYPGAIDHLGSNVVHRTWNKVYTPMTVVNESKP